MKFTTRLLLYIIVMIPFPVYGILHDGDWTSAKGWWIFAGTIFLGYEVILKLKSRKK